MILEKGEVLFLDRNTKKYIELEKGKEHVFRKERNQNNPVKIGRKEPPSLSGWIWGKSKDIVLPEKYRCTSRKHCEIFYDEGESAYFLLDYSLNGTLVNGKRVGGNRQRETRKLEHEDVIEIPAVGEKVKMKFLLHTRILY